MEQFFSNELLTESFLRLRSAGQYGGKGPQERTSALFIFLAFDSVKKKNGEGQLNFDPETETGSFLRIQLALEFAKLALLHPSIDGSIRQVVSLGEVHIGKNEPEKRISSNFLTTSLKKASNVAGGQLYPSRPAPLLMLGKLRENLNWGITHYEGWKSNVYQFVSDFRTSTPFTDLALYVFRDSGHDDPENYREALTKLILDRFTSELSGFLIDRIVAERLFFRCPPVCFRTIKPSVFLEGELPEVILTSSSNERARLSARIEYLERILIENGIDF